MSVAYLCDPLIAATILDCLTIHFASSGGLSVTDLGSLVTDFKPHRSDDPSLKHLFAKLTLASTASVATRYANF